MIRPFAVALCRGRRDRSRCGWIVLAKAAVMGIVEGLTEFLPISSTGHLILTASLLDYTGASVKVFEVAIQTGAMLAVIWEYRARLRARSQGSATMRWRSALRATC